jgi:putative two-component system response regulator
MNGRDISIMSDRLPRPAPLDAVMFERTAVRVLIVEDDELSAEMLENALVQFGYEVAVAGNGHEAIDLLRTGRYRLVISDWEMPGMSGIELCRRIRQRQSSGYVYIILLTARTGTCHVVEGLGAGADDFISKPFQPEELRVRLRAGHRVLSLETLDLTIFCLAKLAESRDPGAGSHLERIREYCRLIAERLAQHEKFRDQVDGDFIQLIYLTSPLHDIGKVGIPDRVLLKPGELTAEEYAIMKRHAAIGGETLDAAAKVQPDAGFLGMARDVAWTHHEWFDGTGYPMGLKGEEIPLSGRILAVADVYDALTTKRVYKPAFDHEYTRQKLIEGMGTHFDPEIVKAFLEDEDRVQEIHRQFASRDSVGSPGRYLACEPILSP